MDERLRNFYLESRVKNASPGALLVLLYDALVEQAEVAEGEIAAAVGSEERTRAPQTITRCIGLVTELRSALRPDFEPTLCSTLANLYRFFANEFYEALTKNDPARIGAILPLLRKLRSTWTQAHRISSQENLDEQVQLVAT